MPSILIPINRYNGSATVHTHFIEIVIELQIISLSFLFPNLSINPSLLAFKFMASFPLTVAFSFFFSLFPPIPNTPFLFLFSLEKSWPLTCCVAARDWLPAPALPTLVSNCSAGTAGLPQEAWLQILLFRTLNSVTYTVGYKVNAECMR